MKWYLKVLRQFTDFEGRARRMEYWMFTLVNAVFILIAMSLDNILGLAGEFYMIGPIYVLYVLAMLLPSLAVGVRRLHDIGKSGWMMLISFIPLIGGIWLLILFVSDSQPGENEYGLNPKEEAEYI
jgi:uncharacterized membrane protein YhaH (DUF805 family)